uniref:Provisional ortholog of phospholipase A2 inhibitor and LY6/PLAUR domain containing n=1 Tax=Xenopus tropicalis TaxID=8364 RepID=A0A6I8SPX2_XENTR
SWQCPVLSCSSLQCVECMNQEGETCTGALVTCPSGDYVCSSTYTLTMMQGAGTSKQFVRQCESRTSCGKAGSITMPGGRIKSNSACCSTDGCDPGTISFPPDKTGKNGQVCESCLAIGSETCSSVTPMECTGEETSCITQITSITGLVSTKMAIRGCSTKEICDVGSLDTDQDGMKMKITVTCSKAIGLQQSLFLLALSGLVLLNLLS